MKNAPEGAFFYFGLVFFVTFSRTVFRETVGCLIPIEKASVKEFSSRWITSEDVYGYGIDRWQTG
jgi:hypothetical protein